MACLASSGSSSSGMVRPKRPSPCWWSSGSRWDVTAARTPCWWGAVVLGALAGPGGAAWGGGSGREGRATGEGDGGRPRAAGLVQRDRGGDLARAGALVAVDPEAVAAARHGVGGHVGVGEVDRVRHLGRAHLDLGAGRAAQLGPAEPGRVALRGQGVVVGQDAVLGDAGAVEEHVVEAEPAVAAGAGAQVEAGLAVAVQGDALEVVGVEVGAVVDAVLAVVVEERVVDVVLAGGVLPVEGAVDGVVVRDVALEGPFGVRVALLGPVEPGRGGAALHAHGDRVAGGVAVALHHPEAAQAELVGGVAGRLDQGRDREVVEHVVGVGARVPPVGVAFGVVADGLTELDAMAGMGDEGVVAGVADDRADHLGAPAAVARLVEVDAVASQLAGYADVAELGVVDGL